MFRALQRCPISITRARTQSSVAAGIRSLSTELPQLSRQRCFRTTTNSLRHFHQARQLQYSAADSQATKQSDDLNSATHQFTDFRDLASAGVVSPVLINTITEELKFIEMTEVQSATINEALRGTDMIAQAKTGTGKTIGFLLPVLQNIIKAKPELEHFRGRTRDTASDIQAIIISPTRELAEQIAAEALKLARNTGIIVQTAVGGTQKRQMLEKTRREGCHLLVGTPGRLNDLLSDSYSGVDAPNIAAIVMDEADRLLDAGFSAEIDSIMQCLPDPYDKDRQTLMFSATVPKDVIHLVRKTLKDNFEFVKTVNDNEVPTHARVPQKAINVHGLENYFPALLELIRREAEMGPDKDLLKVIVYFNTTAEVEFASQLFHELGAKSPIPSRYVETIHGKLSQQQRSRAAYNFRKNKRGLLLSSDVTARGMDFPDVTHVVQVGLPANQDQYIHRIGRTGRAGKEGQGYLITSALESQEAAQRLRGLPLVKDDTITTAKVDMAQPAQLPASAAQILNDLTRAIQFVPRVDKVKVYMAQIGIFQYVQRKQSVVDAINRLAKWGWGMESPPSVPRGVAQKLGIDRCDGITLSERDERPPRREGSFNDPFRRNNDRSRRDGFGGRGFDTSRSSRGARDSGGFGGGRGGRDRHERRDNPFV